MAGDILNIDLVSQAFMRKPLPTLAPLRQSGPVVRVKLPLLGKTWLATTHEVVNKVLKDDRNAGKRNAGQRNAVGFRWWAWLPLLHAAATAVPKTANKEKKGVRTP
jgi:hypothetical protein